MNIRGEKDEGFFNKCFSKFGNVRSYIGTFITNQYLRIKNLNLNPILKSKDRSDHEFQEKSKKDEIIDTMKELVQLHKKGRYMLKY